MSLLALPRDRKSMLYYLKKVDLFRVVQDKNLLSPPTASGAAVTCMTLAFLVILLCGEVRDYFVGYQQCSIVSRPMLSAENSTDYMDLSILFQRAPCEAVDFEVKQNYQRVSQLEELLSPQLYVVPQSSTNCGDMKEKYEAGSSTEGGGCLVNLRAPLGHGKIHLDITLAKGGPNIVKNVRSDHIVCYAQSNPPLPLGVIASITKNTTVPLDSLPQFTLGSATAKFFYYIQNVYTTVRIPNAPLAHGYQLTAEYARVSSRPGVSIEYAVSGFAAQCVQSYATPSHFLVHLCAVAGGVYTVASFLEAGVEVLEKKRKRKQNSAVNAQNTASALAQNAVQ